jgi:hypothetical protein
VHVELGQVKRGDRSHEVAVAAEVEVLAVQELVHIRVAARSEQIVAAAAVLVAAVLNGVGGDRQHRPEIGQARPEPVERRQVRLVELSGAGGPEALARVREAPHVEIGDLRPLDSDDANELARADGPRAARAPGHREPLHERAAGCLAGQPRVARSVDLERRAGFCLVDYARWGHIASSRDRC